MEKPIVAAIQHRLIISPGTDEYFGYLQRFLRTAKAKGSVLAVFPELSGLGVAFPQFTGWRTSLLKEAEQGRHLRAGMWQRTKARLARAAASAMGASMWQQLLAALESTPEALYESYASGYANLARAFGMTIVAGSTYHLDAAAGVIRNESLVFGPDGVLLGQQAKVVLSLQDREIAEAGPGWNAIDTPAGRIGILLGEDALYPEAARILAYQGADMLLALAATSRPATYHRIYQAAMARCQENQLYGLASFLSGPNPLAGDAAPSYLGKSVIFAPLDFTPRYSGVMVEVGSPVAEGVVTAEWDYPALHELWAAPDAPVRHALPMTQVGPILAGVYADGALLPEAEPLLLAPPAAALPALPLLEPEPEIVDEPESEPETPALPEPAAESESPPAPDVAPLVAEASEAPPDEVPTNVAPPDAAPPKSTFRWPWQS